MKNGALILLGVFISRLGDSFSFLAFILILAGKGDSNTWVSLFMVAHYLPGVLIGILGRRCFDRLPKQSSLTAVYLLSAGFTLFAMFDISSLQLLALSFLLGITYGIYVPLQRSFVAEVFPSHQLKNANVWVQFSETLAKTLGFALAGLCFHRLGPSFSFLLDAVSFVFIASLLLLIKRSNPVPKRVESTSAISQKNPALLFASMVFALAWLGTGSLFSLEAAYAKEYLNASESQIGLLFACATLGSLLTPVLIAYLKNGIGLTALVVAALGEMCFVGGYAGSSALIPAIGWIIGYGTLLTTRHIILASWIHTQIPRTQHGSAFAFQQGLANFMMMTGMGVSGPLAELFGTRAVIVCAAAISFAGILLLSTRFSLKIGSPISHSEAL